MLEDATAVVPIIGRIVRQRAAPGNNVMRSARLNVHILQVVLVAGEVGLHILLTESLVRPGSPEAKSSSQNCKKSYQAQFGRKEAVQYTRASTREQDLLVRWW